jgi:hypothetical protein
MTELADFMFVAIQLQGARQVAGFGSARSIDDEELRLALAPPRQPPATDQKARTGIL